MFLLVILVVIALSLGFLYRGRAYLSWVVPSGLLLGLWLVRGAHPGILFWPVALVWGALALAFGVPGFRRRFVTPPLMRALAPMLPKMSDTERAALEAGTVWWDGELFSGNPDWRKLLTFRPYALSREEQDFLDGPVEELCGMVDDWQLSRAGDLPSEVWDFIKKNRFMGMIIPKEYGGLGFSATAHSLVVTKVASRSCAASVTVMVPNSLGPAELLLHYGTDEQKRYYLPRLASGEEIPAFALTEPKAGSDAANGQSVGIVEKGTFRGEEVLGMRLTWDKRYITLGPVATVLGLAFRLKDPDHLLGDAEDLGITCALIPTDLPGVDIGKRHDPLGVPFLNGPTRGHDVFVPIDYIIGGRAMAGQGWRMLMESLAAGRSISLPGLAVGASESMARITGAYASVREQFGLPIGRFEGIQEPLARIAGRAYLMNATRSLTAASVDAGEKPAVISAIAKAYLTEGMRESVNDAMDIVAGAAISRGPRNTVANAYQAVPIGITVEGANILTRNLIIYGQGAIRCHPWVQKELHAVAERDVRGFDEAFFGHVGFTFTNISRSFLLGLSGGRLAQAPVTGPMERHFRQLSRFSAAFVTVSDVAMGTLGADLKRKERISKRMADALAWMYLGSATLKRFVDEGQRAEHEPLAHWALTECEYRIQEALSGVIDNFPNRLVALKLRAWVFPLGARLAPPSDRLSDEVARSLLDDGKVRRDLTEEIYIPGPEDPGLGRLEATLRKVVAARPAEKKLADAVRARRLPRAGREELARKGLEAGIITEDELRLLREADTARDDLIQVDAFEPEFLCRPDVVPIAEQMSS